MTINAKVALIYACMKKFKKTAKKYSFITLSIFRKTRILLPILPVFFSIEPYEEVRLLKFENPSSGSKVSPFCLSCPPKMIFLHEFQTFLLTIWGRKISVKLTARAEKQLQQYFIHPRLQGFQQVSFFLGHIFLIFHKNVTVFTHLSYYPLFQLVYENVANFTCFGKGKKLKLLFIHV